MSVSNLVTRLQAIRQDGSNGDATAAERCEQQLKGGLHRLIRRVICRRWQSTALEQQIAAEVERVRLELPTLQRNDLVNEVAQRLFARIAGLSVNHRIETMNAVAEATVTAV